MTESKLTAEGRIDIATYSDSQLPDQWNTYTEAQKLDYLRSETPESTDHVSNITLSGMHEYFAQNLDDSQAVNKSATHLAIGIDDTAPEQSNETLNNEVFRKQVTDYAQTGNELLCSTFIGSDEANGRTLTEVGLFAGPDPTDTMFNHALIADIIKNDSRTITIDITLSFAAA